jgi:pyruvate formate lyase activating enzyme
MLIAAYVPCSLSDYPGLVAGVVFTQGCNWRCPWCHNKGLLPLRARAGALSEKEVLGKLERRRGQLDGLVVTGGEPTLQKDLGEFIGAVRNLGFRVKLDTNGSNPAVVAELLKRRLLDFVAMDIKAPWERYTEAAGLAVDLAALQSTVRLLRESGISHQLRTTRWPGLAEADFAQISELVRGSPHVWQTYRPADFGEPSSQEQPKPAERRVG